MFEVFGLCETARVGPDWSMGQVMLDDIMACEKCGEPTRQYAQAPASLRDMRQRHEEAVYVVPAIDCYPMCEACFDLLTEMNDEGRARYLAGRTVRISREVFARLDNEEMSQEQWESVEEALFQAILGHTAN